MNSLRRLGMEDSAAPNLSISAPSQICYDDFFTESVRDFYMCSRSWYLR